MKNIKIVHNTKIIKGSPTGNAKVILKALSSLNRKGRVQQCQKKTS